VRYDRRPTWGNLTGRKACLKKRKGAVTGSLIAGIDLAVHVGKEEWRGNHISGTCHEPPTWGKNFKHGHSF